MVTDNTAAQCLRRAMVQGLAYSTLLLHLSLVPYAHAAPTGGAVVGGTGTISQSGTQTTINQTTQNMAIDWQSYNINSNERVQYIQPNSSSISLNRILSNTGSTIAGQIDANGHVILVNPNGVYFTPTSVINVGGIIASGLDIKPSDFMNGNYIFNEVLGTDGGVINSGIINASLGGNVALLGRHVENNGLISANLGTVNLAAGKEAILTFDNQGLLGVHITKEILQSELGVDPAVLNSGTIQAEGGKVLLTASVSKDVFSQAVNTNGIQQATSVVANADGTFTLGGGADVVNTGTIDTSTTSATQNVGRIVLLGNNVTSSGTLKADAANGNGGEIELNSTNMTLLTQSSVTSARSESNGNGGVVKVLGNNNVGLFDQTKVDVSGANGGGQALIGGDLHGTNSQINNATNTIVNRNANIFADALTNGDGGKVVVWADSNTQYLGNIYSRGGVNLGNGGGAEVSGKTNLLFDGYADLSSQNGNAGILLLDPTNIDINSTGNTITGDITFGTPNVTNYAITPNSIRSILSTGGGTDLTLQATNNITVTSSISNPNNTTAHTLKLEAGNAVDINGSISLGVNNLTVISGSSGCGGCPGNSADITVNANLNLTGALSLTADRNVIVNGGNIGNSSQPSSVTINAGGYFENTYANSSISSSGLVKITALGNNGNAGTSGCSTLRAGICIGTINAGSFEAYTNNGSNAGDGRISEILSNTIGNVTTNYTGLNISGNTTFDARPLGSGSNFRSIQLLNPYNHINGTISLLTTGNTAPISLFNDPTGNSPVTKLGNISADQSISVTSSQGLTINQNAVITSAAGDVTLNFGTGNAAGVNTISASVDSDFILSSGSSVTSTLGNIILKASNGGAANTNGTHSFIIQGALSAPAVNKTITLNGDSGSDTIIGPDSLSTNAWFVTGNSIGTLTNGTNQIVNFVGIENLTGGSGIDNFTIQNNGSIANVDTKNGATNSVNVNTGGTVTGNILGGTGADTITIDGTVGVSTTSVGSINTGDGGDTIQLGGTVYGVISGGGNTTGTGSDAVSITRATGPTSVQLGATYNSNATYTIDQVDSITGNSATANTLIAPTSTSNTWVIGDTALSATPYNDVKYATLTTNFSNFASIQGGNTSDTFTVNNVTTPDLTNSVTNITTGNYTGNGSSKVTINVNASVDTITTGTTGNVANTIDIYGKVAGTTTSIDGTAGGANTIHVYAGGSVAGGITTGGGLDQITVDAASTVPALAAASVGAIDVGGGNGNRVLVNGTTGAITVGNGDNNIITVGGTVGTTTTAANIALGTGNGNQVTVNGTGTVNGNITSATGGTGGTTTPTTTTVNVDGTVNGAVSLGNSTTGTRNDNVTVNATGKVTGAITTGTGNDTVIVNGSALSISTGNGSDNVTIASPSSISYVPTGPTDTTPTIMMGAPVASTTVTGDTLTVNSTSNTWAVSNITADGKNGSVSDGVKTIYFTGVDNFNNPNSPLSVLDFSSVTAGTVDVNLNNTSGFSTIIGSTSVLSTLTGKDGANNYWFIGLLPAATPTGAKGTNDGINDGTVIYYTTGGTTATAINFIDFNHLVGGSTIPANPPTVPTAMPATNYFYITNATTTAPQALSAFYTANNLGSVPVLPTNGTFQAVPLAPANTNDGRISGGTGTGTTNYLYASDAPNTWSLDAANGGSFAAGLGNVTTTTYFSGMQYLIGGNLRDTFNFTATAALGSFTNIDGQSQPAAGADVVDFSAAALAGSTIAVDLTANTYSNIETFVGNNNANSSFKGTNSASNWTIKPEVIGLTTYNSNSGEVLNTVTSNTVTFANFPRVIGGTGADTFYLSDGAIANIDGGVTGTNRIEAKSTANNLFWSIYGTNSGKIGTTSNSSNVVGQFANIQELSGGNGTGTQTFDFTQANQANQSNLGQITNLIGSSGTTSNKIIGRNVNTDWTIDDANGGSVKVAGAGGATYVTRFAGIQTLEGGSANDNFILSNRSITTTQTTTGSIVNIVGDTNSGTTGTNTISVNDSILTRNSFWLVGTTSASSHVGSTSTTTDYVGAFSGIQTLTGGNGVDDFTVNTAATMGTLNGGAGNNQFVVNGTVTTLNTNGVVGATDGNNTIAVNNQGLATINASITTVTAGTGNDTITLNTSNGLGSATVGSINAGDGTNNITMNAGSTVTNAITTGTGVDTIAINGATGNRPAASAGSISSGDNNDSITVAGTVSGLIDGGVGTDTLTITANTAKTVQLNGANFTNGQDYSVNRIETINATNGLANTLIGDSAVGNPPTTPAVANTWTINTTNSTVTGGATNVTFNGFANITALAGTDTMIVTNGGSLVNIDLGGGTNGLTVNAGGSVTGTVSGAGANTITVDAASGATVAGNIARISTGGSADTVTINGTAGTISTGDGSDSVSVSGTVTGLIDGGANTTGTGDVFTITATGDKVVQLGATKSTYALAPTPDYYVQNFERINANAAFRNTLNGADTTNTWRITGQNGGLLNTTVNFSNFSNLNGGTAQDNFTLLNGFIGGVFYAGSLSGILDGGTAPAATPDALVISYIPGASAPTTYTVDYVSPPFPVINNLPTDYTISVYHVNVSSTTGNISVISNADNIWKIIGDNLVELDNGSGTLQQFGTDHITGGSKSDTIIWQTGSLTGLVDGRGGDNYLWITASGDKSIQLGGVVNVGTSNLLNITNIQTILGNSQFTNTLIGANSTTVANNWEIKPVSFAISTVTLTNYTKNSGTVDDGNIITTFANFKNLTGGTGADNFKLMPNGLLEGLISGGGGVDADTLTFDSSISGSTVLLKSTNAPLTTANTGNILAVYQVGTVTGNAGSILVGDNTTNWWEITDTGIGAITDGVGYTTNFTNFTNLKGGTGSDTFNVVRIANSTNTGQISGEIHTGAGGTDTLNVNLSGQETGSVNFVVDTGSTATVNIQDAVGNPPRNTYASGNTGNSYTGTYTPSGFTLNNVTYDTISYSNTNNQYSVNINGTTAIHDNLTATSFVANGTTTGTPISLNGSTVYTNGLKYQVTGHNAVDVTGKSAITVNAFTGNIDVQSATSLPNTLTLMGNSVTQGTGATLGAGSLIFNNLVNGVGVQGSPLAISVNDFGVVNSGAVYVTDPDIINLTGSNTTNLVSITANSITSGAQNHFAGALDLDVGTTGSVTLNNDTTTTLHNVTTNALNVTTTLGDIVNTGTISAPNLNLTAQGNITLSNLNNIAAGSSLTADTITLLTQNGIGAAPVGGFTSVDHTNAVMTNARVIDVINTTSGVIHLDNMGMMGDVQQLRLQNHGDIYFNNQSGNLAIDFVSANYQSGLLDPSSAFHKADVKNAGNVQITLGSGSITNFHNTQFAFLNPPPNIAAKRLFIATQQNASIGGINTNVSVSLADAFYLPFTNPRNVYIYYFEGPPPITPANLNVFVPYDGNLSLINLESLGDVDPAIFTQVRNYYYEDVAILMPEDQRLGDDDDKERKKKRQENALPENNENAVKQ